MVWSGKARRVNAFSANRAVYDFANFYMPLFHSGFPTDMQPQMTALLSLARGTSVIKETVFESRDKHVSELRRMGADIILNNGTVFVIKGVKELEGATVTAKDLRGGAALILAGLAAKGETVVLDSKHVERGYEKIEETLKMLGADIALCDSK